jgi:hypothetical protein
MRIESFLAQGSLLTVTVTWEIISACPTGALAPCRLPRVRPWAGRTAHHPGFGIRQPRRRAGSWKTRRERRFCCKASVAQTRPVGAFLPLAATLGHSRPKRTGWPLSALLGALPQYLDTRLGMESGTGPAERNRSAPVRRPIRHSPGFSQIGSCHSLSVDEESRQQRLARLKGHILFPILKANVARRRLRACACLWRRIRLLQSSALVQASSTPRRGVVASQYCKYMRAPRHAIIAKSPESPSPDAIS